MSPGRERPATPTRFHRQPGGRFGAVLMVGIAALCAFNAVANDPPLWVRVANVVLLLLLLAAVPAQWRAGVTVGPAGVFARTPLGRRNVHLSWAQVDHFEMRGYWRGLVAVTPDGRLRSVMQPGFQTGNIDETVRQLEEFRWQQQRSLGLV